jgi:hypothetical protein
MAQFATKLKLVQVQTLGRTYSRLNKELKAREFLSYAGNNGCTWSWDARYYHHNCPGVTFGEGKSCLTLIEVCFLDSQAIIENVRVSKNAATLNLFLYHMYE